MASSYNNSKFEQRYFIIISTLLTKYACDIHLDLVQFYVPKELYLMQKSEGRCGDSGLVESMSKMPLGLEHQLHPSFTSFRCNQETQ